LLQFLVGLIVHGCPYFWVLLISIGDGFKVEILVWFFDGC